MSLVIVFDLDDTLYLERDYVRSGFQAVGGWAARNLGISDFAARAQDRFESGMREGIFDAILSESRCGESVAPLVEVYRDHRAAITLLEDASACLNGLRGTIPCALITDGASRVQRQKVAALGLEWMSPVIVTDEHGIEFRKPNRFAFEKMESNFGGKRSRFVYVGDNPKKDFAVPLELGWIAIRIRRPGGLHYDVPNLAGATPHFEIRDLNDLTRLPGLEIS